MFTHTIFLNLLKTITTTFKYHKLPLYLYSSRDEVVIAIQFFLLPHAYYMSGPFECPELDHITVIC